MDLVEGRHKHSFMILYFYWTLSLVGRIQHRDLQLASEFYRVE